MTIFLYVAVVYWGGEVDMEIVIYWDSLFLVNFIMNYCLLRVLIYKFSLETKRYLLIFAAFLGSGIYVFDLLFMVGTRLVPFLEMAVSIPLMILMILPKKDRRLFLRMIFYGFFYTFFVAGVLRTLFLKRQLFLGKTIHIFFVIIAGYIIIEGILFCLQKEKRTKSKRLFCVTLRTQKNETIVTALLDTGNGLLEPISKKPVCLVESDVLEKLIGKESALYRAVPYCSVGCEKGILYATQIPEMQILYNGKELLLKEVFCAKATHKLSTNNTYNMILHPNCVKEI